MIKNQNRQGDVLLHPIKEIPATAKPEKVKGRAIIALGEATGHHHSFMPGSVRLFRDQEMGNLLVQVRAKGAALEHQEHGTIPHRPGSYTHIHQKEYAPEAIRNVMD